MKQCTIVIITALVFGLVYCGPIQKRSAGKEGEDATDLDDLFPADLLNDLANWAKKLAGPFVDTAKEYKDEPVGFNDHDVQYQMINGSRVKVETSVEKKLMKGKEITVIDKKVDDGKNGTVVAVPNIVAYVEMKSGAKKNKDESIEDGNEDGNEDGTEK